MIARCKHENFTIHEVCEEISTWMVIHGVLDEEAIFQPGNIEACVMAHCDDCKKDFRFSKYGYMPKWLKKHVDVITGAA